MLSQNETWHSKDYSSAFFFLVSIILSITKVPGKNSDNEEGYSILSVLNDWKESSISDLPDIFKVGLPSWIRVNVNSLGSLTNSVVHID